MTARTSSARSSSRRWLALALIAAATTGATALTLVVAAPDATTPPDAPAPRATAARSDAPVHDLAPRPAPPGPPAPTPAPASSPPARGDIPDDPTRAAAVEAMHQRVARLDQAFTGEHDDPTWSGPATERMRASFTGHLPSGATLDGIDCRSSLCRVGVRFSSANDLELDVGDLPTLVPWSAKGHIHADERDPKRAVLYAAREGEPMPQ